MIIDKQIILAMEKAVAQHGSKTELANRAGISFVLPGKYMSGKVVEMPAPIWEKLFPVLSPFLPQVVDGGKSLPLPEYRPASWWREHPQIVAVAPQPSASLPCGKAPRVLHEFCEHLDEIDPGRRESIFDLMEVAIKKSTQKAVPPNQESFPAAKAG